MKKIIFIFLILSTFISGCGNKKLNVEYNSYERTSAIMGTFMEIKVRDNTLPGKKIKFIIDRAFQLAATLESRLSIYNPESEINLLNKIRIMDVSQDLFNVLKASCNTADLTGGDFDITVSPVLKMDGFYSDMPSDILTKIPDNKDGIGCNNIIFSENRKVILTNDNTWLDLSGIAKGYIVDRVSEFFIKEGLKYFLINAGGDIYCGDKEPSSLGWRVGIREPNGELVVKILSLKNIAIATSGDYENIIIDQNTGEVISHIIDPVSKVAIREQPSSITVIADTCAVADSFATGMMVMGADRAIELANTLDAIEIITSHKSENKDILQYSNGAKSFFIEERS